MRGPIELAEEGLHIPITLFCERRKRVKSKAVPAGYSDMRGPIELAEEGLHIPSALFCERRKRVKSKAVPTGYSDMRGPIELAEEGLHIPITLPCANRKPGAIAPAVLCLVKTKKPSLQFYPNKEPRPLGVVFCL
jgi:hypothetical protein